MSQTLFGHSLGSCHLLCLHPGALTIWVMDLLVIEGRPESLCHHGRLQTPPATALNAVDCLVLRTSVLPHQPSNVYMMWSIDLKHDKSGASGAASTKCSAVMTAEAEVGVFAAAGHTNVKCCTDASEAHNGMACASGARSFSAFIKTVNTVCDNILARDMCCRTDAFQA